MKEFIVHKLSRIWQHLFVRRFVLLLGVLLLVLIIVFHNPIARFLGITRVVAATYQMQTGYYVGSGSSNEISGLGFTPEVVILKADTAGGTGAIMKTIGMPKNNVAYLGVATADNTTAQIQFTPNGFIVTGTLSDTVNNRYTWVAFSGSDCSAGGQLCVGRYTGDGNATQAVPTGFDPDLVIVKQSTAVLANWRSSSMPDNYAQFFSATLENSTGAYFTTLDATGFSVGATNNAVGGIYSYMAFKEVAGVIDVGTYTGNTSDNRSIPDVGFRPDWLFTKNANATVGAVYSLNESYGDSSSYFADTANLINAVQALESDGFQVGTSNTANGNGNTHYYAAFGGAVDHSAQGTFTAVSGTYVGDGNARVISNLGFAPDLVIVKASSTEQAVFSTSMMGGDSTAYLGVATANFAGGITTLSPNGFTIGSHATVNTNGVEYVWTAYGNAWNPKTNTGSQDFVIGAYYGNGLDNRSITRLPFSPDFLTVKTSGATQAVWRSSEHVGDVSSYFHALADGANQIQSLTVDGFQIGTLANVNTAASLYWYFGFATGTNFAVGTYSGTGVAHNVDTSFAPDHAWVKQTGAVQGVLRTASTTGATSFPFLNTALVQDALTGFYANGFSVGTGVEANTLGVNNYRYVVWADTTSRGTATYKTQTGYYVGDGGVKEISGLGFTPDMVIVKANTTAGTGAVWKTVAMPQNNTAYLGSATADNAAGLIVLTNDGFRVAGTGINDLNNRFTWVAFSGSECSSGGTFCVGRYTGDGGATKAIPSGFQPDLVWVKRSTAVLPTWRSSVMPVNYAQYFSATVEDTTGTFFTTLDANGFTVGTTHNVNAGIYYFATFKESVGEVDVGTYAGNTSDNRSIGSVGFRPDWLFTKNANVAVGAVHSLNESYGDSSSYFADTANLINAVQALESDGFQVGTSNTANGNGNTHYYAAFGGATPHVANGTYQMNSGSYVGTGNTLVFSDLGFEPDLVIIKGNTTQAGVFSTRIMGGNSTAYLDSPNANFAEGITSLQSESFSIGTDATVNTPGVTYYWTAFGNAWNPDTNSGAADFVIGAYYGNGIDNRSITHLPFSPDMLTIKNNGVSGGVWRSTEHTGDLSSYFTATLDGVNLIQTLNTDGFQVGNASNVNATANMYWYFGFATSSTFALGTYSGNGTSQDITVGFQPFHLWIKRTTATQGVWRFSDIVGDGALPFINSGSVAGAITGTTFNGFSLGSAAETNANGINNYRYVAWQKSILHQVHYHWRENNGNEAEATSATGGVEDTPLSSTKMGRPYRLRLEVSNEGEVNTNAKAFRLEYGEKVTSCGDVSTWTRVGEAGGAWDMYDSLNLTHGENTTNIASAEGGVPDENTHFLTPNGAVLDTGDETGMLTVNGADFLELEYAISPTSFAIDTTQYCFRVSDQGAPLSEYPRYPEATYRIHAFATTTGAQVAEMTIPSVSQHVGGAFVIVDNGSVETHTVTDVTITETGTVDAQNSLDNITLLYEFDTTAPYDCASESYGGSELQYGVTDADGFSGANGTASFAGAVSASSTQAVCLYPIMDVTTNALSGETIELQITSGNDVVLGGGDLLLIQSEPLEIPDTTTLTAPLLTQTHYHWRLDNGSESGAGSATEGNEDTVLTNFPEASPQRIRVQVSNEGISASTATTFRLEYALLNGTCSATTEGWTNVASVDGAWDMYNSLNLTEGNSTTNIGEATGGVTDENAVFLTPNGGVRDTTSETGALILEPDEFVELEYSVVALAGAVDGGSYCFRVTDSGTALPVYNTFPEVAMMSDVFVSAQGAHVEAVQASSTNNYLGGTLVLQDFSGPRDVNSIILSETGTVDAQNNLKNIKLLYELDSSSPYTCASESYDGNEEQYGSTAVNGFSSANGTITFTETVGITDSFAICVYAVMDVDSDAGNLETIQISIANPSTDVSVSTGTINPSYPVGPTGSTTIEKSLLVLEHYHFRNDDGSESLATSKTGGVEDVPITGALSGVVERLRFAVSNKGATSSDPSVFTLEYAERVTTCSAISEWATVGSTGAVWSPSESEEVTAGSDTTNIAAALGGVSDENAIFLTPNSGVIENTAVSDILTLEPDEFMELEYVIEPNIDATAGTTYCFRVRDEEGALAYETYAEAVVSTNQDFYIQRGVSDIANTTSSVTITAGVEYVAPKASTSAFIRITNASHTGAGATSGGGTQNASNVTTSIQNPSNITNSVTFQRTGITNSTRIYWEIIEYTGPAGGDNEMIVRAQENAIYGSANTTVTTPTIEDVANDNDVVVFITGQQNPSANSTGYPAGLSTAVWNSGSDDATFTRGITGSVASVVSYAIVEFTGDNWKTQRSEHTYNTPGATEVENITPVNDLSRAFLHTQKRVIDNRVDEYGHQVWLSSVGQVAYSVPGTVRTASSHTSVAWVIENTQITGSPMVVARSNATQNAGGVEPSTYSIAIGRTLSSLSNGSIFMNMWGLGTDTVHPRAIMGAGITSTTFYQLWISDTGTGRAYRTEVVDWPTAVLKVSQNYFRFYVDNDTLDPTDPWPLGVADLGENTTITGLDMAPSDGDRVRVRMSLSVSGANISQGTKQYKLQYGTRDTACSAISTWLDTGDSASTTVLWRGYNATPLSGSTLSTNPPTVGDLNLSVSSRAGTYEEANPTALNPYKIYFGDDVEYDWILEANGVVDFSSYCFRMVESDGSELDEYLYYPTITIAGFDTEQKDWRWYDDETAVTPVSSLAATNTAPSNIPQAEVLKLRVLVEEIAGRDGGNTKFKLQWSEFSDFSVVTDVTDRDSCTTSSPWCYADGAGAEGEFIDEAVLATSDSCVGGVGDGCGTYNEYSYTPEVVGEVGTTTADSVGTTVTLAHTYIDPVFIVEAISGDTGGGALNRPAVAIITGTTTSSFTVRIQEPDNEPDTHGEELLSYIVMERGSYTLPDGRKVDVNTLDTNHYYGNAVSGASDDTCTFTQTFSSTPVILTSLQTNNNTNSPDFLTTSIALPNANTFACSIEVPDGETAEPTNTETIGWIAIEGGVFTNNGIAFEATTTTESITGWADIPWYEQAFTQLFIGIPGIIAHKQTRNGAEGGWVRYGNVDADSAQFAIDERDDGELTHTSEVIAYLAHATGGVLYRAGDSGFVFTNVTKKEFEFTLQHNNARNNMTYFFRLYDVERDTPVTASTTLTSYPSLSTEGATLSFSIQGVTAGFSTEGYVADVETSATSIPFGVLELGVPKEAVQRLTVTTNATEGYQVVAYERQNLMSSGGVGIEDIAGSNSSPVPWTTGCLVTAQSCYGYHAGDNTLTGGSTRFLLNDTFAPLTETLEEIAYSSGPVHDETTDIIYRIGAGEGQPAGIYESKIVYIVLPVF